MLKRKLIEMMIDKLQLEDQSPVKEKVYWFQAAQMVFNLAFDVYNLDEIL